MGKRVFCGYGRPKQEGDKGVHGQAGNAVIGIHSGKDPVRVLPDIFREILLLGLETVLLRILHGGHSGVSSDPLQECRLRQ